MFLGLVVLVVGPVQFSGNGQRFWRVYVHMAEQQRLRRSGTIVLPRALITIAARADLEIERTVHPIFLGT